jgi:glutathione peroxidase
MAKIDVNGSQAEPLFQFLKQQAPGVLGTEMIKWNFTKFLVNKQGQVIKRFAPTTEPAEIESEIQKLLTY